MENKGKNLTIIDVFPIGRGMVADNLSFFTGDDVSIGDFVMVPIRNKRTLALVSNKRTVSDAKTELKKAKFSLKKANSLKATSVLLPEFIKAIIEISHYYVSSPGAVLHSLLPIQLAKEISTIPSQKHFLGLEKKKHFDTYVIQTEDKERYAEYKGIIREEFARMSSVFFCVPTIEDARKAEEELSKGIENYTYVMHGGISKTKIIEVWKESLLNKHTVLIIATPQFLSLPRLDIGSIIIEKESDSAYKKLERPFIDIRTGARIIAKNFGARIIYGDTLLRIETIWKQREGAYVDIQPLKFRTLNTAKEKIATAERDIAGEKLPFSPITTDLKKLLLDSKKNNEKTFVLVGRKGLSPTIVCDDCGTLASCQNCDTPVTLHKSPRGSIYVCHKCGKKRDPEVTCKNCRGLKLSMIGIGTENVAEEIQKLLPDTKVLILDKEVAKTAKQAERIISDFYDSPGSVLVGTQMALNYLREQVENVAIASIDSLFSLPDFRIHERIVHILISARAKAQKNFLIQTRNGDIHIFKYGMEGSLLDFYRENIEERKELFYPPFSTLIRISIEGDRAKIIKEMENVQKEIGAERIDVFPAFIARKNKKTSIHALIRVHSDDWPDESLYQKLRNLPPAVIINVEPESIL